MQFSSVVIGLVLLNALILASTTSTTTCGATNTLEKMTNNIQHNYVNITITQISYSLIYKLWNAVSMGAIYRGHTPPLLVTCPLLLYSPLAVCSPSGAVVVPALDLGRRIHSLLQHRLPYMGAHPGNDCNWICFFRAWARPWLKVLVSFFVLFFECVINFVEPSLTFVLVF